MVSDDFISSLNPYSIIALLWLGNMGKYSALSSGSLALFRRSSPQAEYFPILPSQSCIAWAFSLGVSVTPVQISAIHWTLKTYYIYTNSALACPPMMMSRRYRLKYLRPWLWPMLSCRLHASSLPAISTYILTVILVVLENNFCVGILLQANKSFEDSFHQLSQLCYCVWYGQCTMALHQSWSTRQL